MASDQTRAASTPKGSVRALLTQAVQEFAAEYVSGVAEYLAEKHPALFREIWDVQRRMARLARAPMPGPDAEGELRAVVDTWRQLWKAGGYFFKTSAAALPPDPWDRSQWRPSPIRRLG